ncbi:MAG: diadenylate cyclase [Chitinophagaceae bacterium]|nr:diadenylate cyclase [Chitinophagaceae bacterium]
MFQESLGYFKQLTAIQFVDIALVLLIIFQMFRALRGSIAFNIFIGALVIYILWLIVNRLKMPLMSEILDRLVSIGLIGLLVVFQPEIRKFLIVLGRRSPLGKNGFISRLFQANTLNKYIVEEDVIEEITNALKYFQEKKLGAIIVIARSERFEFDTNTGNMINGSVSAKLLESIFSKSSPLHDGAVIIDRNNLIAAGVVLPISHSAELPSHVGLRHRSAVGATEHNDVLVIVISEETSKLSLAYQGKISMGVPMEEVKKEMYNAMTS